ncbi:hypothetical protein C5E06_02225 [Pseudoclavibacter sp. RFBI5]|nr:hypothetical protein C5B99_02950 [Pseudoclavibacter sp. Z016]PPG05186.1 hypothetical protein C5E06_02225 [Pseudoclavibacter sp. RFBI5]
MRAAWFALPAVGGHQTMTVAPDDDGIGAKAVRGIGWIVLERWASRFIALGVFALLARFIAPGDFGLLALSTVFTAILQVFVDSSFNKVLVQRLTLEPKDASTTFWTSLGISVVIYVALFFSAPLIALLLGEPELGDVLRVQSIAIVLAALSSTPAALLERDFHFKQLSIRKLAGTVAGAGVAVPMAIMGYGVWALVGQALVQSFVGFVTLWAASRWRPKFEFSWTSLRSMASIGFSVLGVELLSATQANIDKLVIGAAINPTALGYYFFAQRILTITSELVTSVVGRVSLTTFSRTQGDVAKTNVVMRSLTFASSAVAIPVFLILGLLAPDFIPYLFGEEWVASIPVFQLLIPSIILVSVTYFDGSVLIAAGRAKSAFGLALAQNIVGVILLFVALPFGIQGVALSRSVRVILLWPLRLVLLAKQASIAIGPYMGQLIRCTIAAVPMVALLLILDLTPWAAVEPRVVGYTVPAAITAFALYLGVLWFVAGREQRTTIIGLVRKLRRRSA